MTRDRDGPARRNWRLGRVQCLTGARQNAQHAQPLLSIGARARAGRDAVEEMLLTNLPLGPKRDTDCLTGAGHPAFAAVRAAFELR